jgi:predicted adenylyl cyclase CyaB
MIEVEKNFDLRAGDKERLIEGSKFLHRKIFQDIYYDDKNYRLTKNDYWFRQRQDKWELKVPLNKESISNRLTDQYHELESDDEIVAELNLPKGVDISESIARMGYEPFAKIVTTRESYQKGDFHLDFDEMDFGFTTFEAELMVKSNKEVPLAEKRILNFAVEHGITENKGRGKVIEYLARFKPKHYEALLQVGVIQE